MFEKIKNHFTDQMLTYLVGGAIAGIVGGAFFYSADVIGKKLDLYIIGKLTTILADAKISPDSETEKGKEEPDSDPLRTDALKKLRVSLENRVKEINQTFIGFVQIGTFKISDETAAAWTASIGSNYVSEKQYAFQIFAGNNSHIYLEFDITNFDHKSNDLQLYFFETPVCLNHDWHPGLNYIEFKIINLRKHIWEFQDDCHQAPREFDQKEGASFQSVMKSKDGHKSQLIPVRLKALPKTASKDPQLTSLKDALSSSPPSSAGNSSGRTGAANGAGTVSYIVVVRPLVEDDLLR